MHDILKAGCHAVSVVAKDAVPQGGVRKIEFLLRFQDLLTLQIKTGTAVKQIGFLQFFQVAVNRFVIQRTVLRFQIIRNGFCREGVAHIVEGVLDHSFQLVDLPHLIALDNIREDRGVVNITHDGVDLVLRELLQMRCRETAQAYIVDKLRLRLSHLGIMAFEHQVLAKGQSEDAERYISSRQIG